MPPDPLQVVRNRLKSDYPRPDLNQEWLTQCVRALQEADPSATVPTLIRSTETQLLLSDLAASCLPNDSGLPAPSAEDEYNPYPAETILFGPAKKDSCLVMITSIMEIGSSAFQLGTVKQQRAEALSGAAKIRRLRVGGEDGEGLNGGEEDEEDDEVADGDIPPYPRGMLMLEISDGHRYMKAMEYKRISGLQLGETALGSKLLLRNVRSLRGILLLAPDNVTIKGHMVEEMEELQGHYFENGLRVRMGKPPLELPDAEDRDQQIEEEHPIDEQIDREPAHGAQQQQQQPGAGPSRNIGMARDGGARQFTAIEDDEEDDFDMDMDDDLLAAIEMDQMAGSGAPPPTNQHSRSARSSRRSARTHRSTDPFEFPEPDEDELEAVMAVERTQMTGSGARRSQPAVVITSRGADILAKDADDDNDDGMDWAALAEIEEEEKRATRFPGYQDAAKSTGRAKKTLPARLQTVLPSRGQSRPPATQAGPSRLGNAAPYSEAGESAIGEVSRFFAGTASDSKGKGKETAIPLDRRRKAVGDEDQGDVAVKQGKRRGAVAPRYVDVDSDVEDASAARLRGLASRASQPKATRTPTAVGISEHGADRADDAENGDTSEDSQKENKRPPVRKAAVNRTDPGRAAKDSRGGSVVALDEGVIDLLDDSE